jgi:hypothetical protein
MLGANILWGGGRIVLDLSKLPAGTDLVVVKGALVAQAVDWLRTEFSTSASIAGATPDKLAGMVEGGLGKLLL